MSRAPLVRLLVVCPLVLAAHVAAHAQPMGTFRWQLQPYCNVVTLNVTQTGGVYTLDGYDDQCGAGTRAPLTGTAAPNPDGTTELGFGIVASPSAIPVHVAVAIDTTTLGGTWTDSAGHTGAFTFRPNGGSGGEPRPAAAAIGATAVNPEQVQLRVSGTCPEGQYVERINQGGSVTCGSISTNGITAVVAYRNGGLVASTTSGTATLRLATTGSGAFDFSNDSGFLSDTPIHRLSSALSVGGPGKRVVWYPGKSAFRAGRVFGAHWDDANIGVDSVAFGSNTVASGPAAFASGADSSAGGVAATAIGSSNIASGDYSVALGSNARALARGSFIYSDAASQSPVFATTNQFVVRASGGARFYTNAAMTTGVMLAENASAWSSLSDVATKEHFRDLDGDDVLAKIARMPIREWNDKAQDTAIRHVGPTAQDFHAAFGLGEDPLRISTIDADGIALRAVQALEARTREADETLARENAALEAELAALKAELTILRDTLRHLEVKATPEE